MRRRKRVSEVAVETSETFCSLLKAVEWGDVDGENGFSFMVND